MRANRILLSLAITVVAAAATLKIAFGARGDDLGAVAPQLGLLFAFTVFATVGGLILVHHPRHRIGSIYLMGAIAGATGTLAGAVVDAASVKGWTGPPVTAAWWLASMLSFVPLIVLIPLPLLLFPSGRLPSRRWRHISRAAIVSIALIEARFAFWDGYINGSADAPINPFRIPGSKPALEALAGVGTAVVIGASIASVVSLFVRFRRASGIERQQLKWLGWAGVWTALLLFTGGPGLYGGLIPGPLARLVQPTVVYLPGVAVSLIPAATAVAILRYRLYDIDRIVSKTVGYVLITGTLVAAYAGLVVLFQQVSHPLTGGSDLAVAASTLVVAAAFRPVRRRVQSVIDRRFNRTRYDMAEAVDVFTSRLRDEIDIDTLTVDLETLVLHAMEPEHVSLWLRKAPA